MSINAVNIESGGINAIEFFNVLDKSKLIEKSIRTSLFCIVFADLLYNLELLKVLQGFPFRIFI